MTNHSFFLEIILRPLIDNFDIKEVDTMWSKELKDCQIINLVSILVTL